MFGVQWPPLDVVGGGIGPQVNTFEQVSSDNQISVKGEGVRYPGLMPGGGGEGRGKRVGALVLCLRGRGLV